MATMNKYIAHHLAHNAGTTYDTPITSAVMRNEPVSEESHNNSKRLAQQVYANQDSSETQNERIVNILIKNYLMEE